HVGMPRRPEHDLRARRASPAEAVGGAILGPAVRLRLHDPPGHGALGALVDEEGPDAVAGDLEHVPSVEAPWERRGSPPSAPRGRWSLGRTSHRGDLNRRTRAVVHPGTR